MLVLHMVAAGDWNLPEWLTVVGFPGVVAALIIAAFQLRHASKQSKAAVKAATAAESAILRTERHLADIQLVTLLLQIPTLQRDLEHAVADGNKEDSVRHLSDYGRLAVEALAILERRGHGGSGVIVATLREATAKIGKAKNEIIRGDKTPEEATRAARDHIGVVAAEGTRIIGAMKAFTNTADDGEP